MPAGYTLFPPKIEIDDVAAVAASVPDDHQ
jgi:hypothetical protein